MKSGLTCCIIAVSYTHLDVYKRQAQGWVGHDAKEIAENIIRVVQAAVRDSGIDSRRLAGVAVTNQRESVALWERDTGCLLYTSDPGRSG